MGNRESLLMKSWSAKKATIYCPEEQPATMHVEIMKYMCDEGEEAPIRINDVELNENTHWFEMDISFRPFDKKHKPINFTIVLDLEEDEVIYGGIKDLIYYAKVHLASEKQFNFDVNLDSIRNEREVLRRWVIPSVLVETNVGNQVVDLHCYLEKIHFDKHEFTLFERKVLGYRLYKHMVEVIPSKPIRQNRDKDYLPPYSEEGNDAIHSFAFQVEQRLNGKIPDLTTHGLSEKVLSHIKNFGSKEHVREKRKSPWWNRTLYKKYFGDERLSVWTAIYPFHGDLLSGRTDILSFKVENDDEFGLGFTIGILGFHLTYNSPALRKLLQKCFIRNRPSWEPGMEWSTYYPILKKWQREHRFEYFFDAEWYFKVGIDRASGFHYRSEFDHSSGPKGSGNFNPWRNKLWNLI